MNEIKQKITTGILWSTIERLSLQGVRLIVSIVLARLLEPSQFGLIGMLSIFMALAQLLLDSGFRSALIQKKDADHVDFCSIFYLNILIGFVLAGILAVSAPAISRFFDQPQLISLTRFLSLNIIFNSFGLVHSSLLSKEMKFKAQFKISLIAGILSGIIGVILAYFGFGIWSIAVQSVLSTLFINIMLWLIDSWRPTLIFSMDSVRSMFSFGSKLLAAEVISTIFQNIYQTFIGKVYTATDLGFYTRARSMLDALINITSGSLSRVIYPYFTPLQDDLARLKTGFTKTIRLSVFLHFPLMIGLWAIADPLIILLMTEKWSGSIPIFKLLCIVNIFYPLDLLNLNVLEVRGRTDLYLRISLIKKVVTIFSILITFKGGIITLLYGQIAASMFMYFLNSYYSGQLVNYNFINQLRDVFPSFFTAIIMGGIMYLIGFYSTHGHLLKIMLQGIIGIGIYALLNWVIKSSEMNELKNLTLGLFNISRVSTEES